jgi:hypothetical protein
VRPQGKAAADDGGEFHPLGLTMFWAMQGWKHDRERMQANVRWASREGFDYLRILCEVGWGGGIEIDPTAPQWLDYDQVLRDVIDFVYDECAMRVELTILGKGTGVDKVDLADRVARIVAVGRQHKVIHFEMANEYAITADAVPLETLEQMAHVVRSHVPNPIALSAPEDGSQQAVHEVASRLGGPVNMLTIHIERDKRDAGWRQVRQGYDFKNHNVLTSSNEPPGPASSVETNTDPLQLAMMRAVGVMCGGSLFVLHTGTGVFGDGKPHPTAGPRPANFWEIDNIDTIVDAVRRVDALLPDGVENWKVANTGWVPPNPVAPFQPESYWEGDHGHGVNKAYSAIAPDGRVIQMPIGVKGDTPVRMTASYAMRDVLVYDPLTLQTIGGPQSFVTGEVLELPASTDSMRAYIIHGWRV